MARTATKPVSAATRAMLDEMSADAPRASEDKLDLIREKLRELRLLEREKQDLEERLSQVSERRRALTDKEIVDVMDEAKVSSMTLDAEGNLPAFTVEVGPYYHANIAADWEPQRRDRAFAWIGKYHPGMLRTTVTVSLGKNSEKALAALLKTLEKGKYKFTKEFGVPWNTLTAFVKEQVEEHGKTPPLDLLGATVGRVAKIKKQKEN